MSGTISTSSLDAATTGDQRVAPAAHTPGPWLRGEPSHNNILQNNEARSLIAVVSTWSMSNREAEAQANARLIVAAPDLKAFAESIQIYQIEDDARLWLRVGNAPACSFNAMGLIAHNLLLLEAARSAAIAKAEGR